MNQKAVIYARYSSDKQTEQSIEGQLRECNEFAKKNNITVIGNYIDRALTGTTDKRPEFLKMIEDGKKKVFNYVIVYQLDRFARNRFDSATYKAKLSRNNIRVLSARENITDDASGVLVEGVLESMAEYFSKELSQKVTRGMKESLLKGNWTGGRLTYGYDIKDKKYVINEEESRIVKEIFEGVVINKTVEEIFKPELLKEIAENIVKTFNNEIKDDYQVKSYQNQIDDVSKKIDNIMKAIEEGIITSTTKEKLLTYESLKTELLEQIATAKNKSIKPLETSEIMAFLKGFAELNYSKEENRTRLLEMFVHKIYLYDDYALIAYNGTNNPSLELKLEHKKTERELLFEFGLIGAPNTTKLELLFEGGVFVIILNIL